MAKTNSARTSEIHTTAPASGAPVVTVYPGLGSPDLVDAIFDYIVAEFPEIRERAAELRAATREEFRGIETYIPQRSAADRKKLMDDVLRLFNGRNATEVARRLNISRATVYRYIKTSG